MKRFLELFVVLVLLVAGLIACGASSTERGPQIKVVDAWARPSPLKAGNGAVYMKLSNEGGADDALVGAQTDAAAVVELHESKMEGDVMKMSPVSKIVVPAGGSATLEPGGLHVMLINLTDELVAGETINLTLKFEQSDPITIEAEIREMGAMGQ